MPKDLTVKSDEEVSRIFIDRIRNWLEEEALETNEIFLRIMEMVFSEKILIGDVDLLKLLTENFTFSETQKWLIHDKFAV